MDGIRINVLATYDLKFCAVCTQNSGSNYINCFENVIVYSGAYISISEIIAETLGYHVSLAYNRGDDEVITLVQLSF